MDNFLFDATESFDSSQIDKFLQEVTEVAQSIDLPLGENNQTLSNEMIPLIALIREEIAELPPVLSDVIKLKLDDELLVKRKGAFIEELSKNYDFYYSSIPITLLPKAGWAFWRLEFQLTLESSENGLVTSVGNKVAIIHDMFPNSSWQSIMSLRDSLHFGIDTELGFNLPSSELLTQVAYSSAEIKSGAKYDLIVGPFEYNVKRPQILSTGKGNTLAAWRLDGGNNFQKEEIKLFVILKVPKSLDRLSAVGRLRVYRRFDMLSAQFNDIWQFLSEKVRTYFHKDAPLYDEKKWENFL